MRGISRFEVGSIPARPQEFQFYDEDGETINVINYESIEVDLLGSNNEKIDLTGMEIRTGTSGRLTFIWPRREIFTETGQYLLRFKFVGSDSVDFSETHEIRVTDFGRVNN